MLIDVQDHTLNLILNACFLGMVAVLMVSLVPWPLRDGRNRWFHFLPITSVTLYYVYETTMPSRMDIRLDLALIWPVIALSFFAWLGRVAHICWTKRHK